MKTYWHIYYIYYISTISYILLFWAALTHAMIDWGLTIQYKREREEKRKKRANPVNCHHIHVIKSTVDKGTTDYETDVWMLQYMYIYIFIIWITKKKFLQDSKYSSVLAIFEIAHAMLWLLILLNNIDNKIIYKEIIRWLIFNI